jgi:large subunit ribosomal protein L4
VSIDIRTPEGGTAGGVELPAEIFDVQANIPLMHQVVVAQLAAARQGTHDTKTRAEVSGGGRKPYRQKGTGRARQGSIRAPHYAGGGISHGPTPRNYAQRTPKKMKAAALRGALSDRAREGRVHVISGVVDGDQPSTRSAIALLAGLSAGKHVLVVVQRDDMISTKSLRNVDRVHMLWPGQLNTYDVLVSDDVVFTRGALDEFLSALGTSVTEVDASAASEAVDEPAPVKKATAAKKAPAKQAAAPTAEVDADATADESAAGTGSTDASLIDASSTDASTTDDSTTDDTDAAADAAEAEEDQK